MPKKIKTTQKRKKAATSSKALRAQPKLTGIAAKIVPLQDRIVIKEDTDTAEKKTSAGIIIPVTVTEDKGGKRGTVVAVGPGRIEDGAPIELSVEIGDKVIFQWGDKVRIDDEDYYIVRESEILAVIK